MTGWRGRKGVHTGVDQRDGVIDGFLGVCLERGCHVWERRLPFERRAEIAVRAHGAEVRA